MKKLNLAWLSFTFLAFGTTVGSVSIADPTSCIDYYSKEFRAMATPQVESASMKRAKVYFSAMVPVNLITFRPIEIRQVASGRKVLNDARFFIANDTIDALNAKKPGGRWTTQEIVAELNEQSMNMLGKFEPNDSSDRRLDAVTKELAFAALRSIDRHPVVGIEAAARYEQPGTSIGFCFGRGCYEDKLFMRLGVDRDSVKKIWATGTMRSGDINWDFHIGYAVRATDGNWYVVDNVPGNHRILDYRAWAENFKAENADQDLRIYITDGDKFTASLGRYDKVQMGFYLPRDQDWYRGYFQDLIAWFDKISDEELAKFLRIPELPKRPEPVNPTEAQKRESLLEERLYSQTLPQSLPHSLDDVVTQNPGGIGGKIVNTLKDRWSKLFGRQ